MNVLTLTMNPVLDKNTSAKLVMPEHKIRCKPPVYAPGGGGINVSRAIKKLGGDSVACFPAGGENGKMISSLLDHEGINHKIINTGVNTRENLIVLDETTGSLYRFGMPGLEINEEQWKNTLKIIKEITPKPDMLVASGSLPLGIPDDFYARVAKYSKNNNIKMILDTSGGIPYELALEEGVYMIKPNLRELAILLKKDALTGVEQEEAAKEILNKGYCDIMVLSLGARGAIYAGKGEEIEYITPPSMPVISTVGAGDSMVAGIITGFTMGFKPSQAVRYGVAAGTAAAMTPGSELCRKKDTEEIFKWFQFRIM